MNDNLKRTLNEEIASDCGEDLSLKKLKMEQNKTPISILHELCTKVSKFFLNFINAGLSLHTFLIDD